MKYFETQDPKFLIAVKADLSEACLVNSKTLKPVKSNEPLFILRAQDKHTIEALQYYRFLCNNPDHKDAVEKRVNAFSLFSLNNSSLMKEPDTK